MKVFLQKEVKVKPIYYIGKEDIEKKKKLKDLKKEAEDIKEQLNFEEK